MSSDSSRKKLITAALPYANGPIHIGHLAGAYLPADIYARYLRLKGEDVLFVCGSDEHGAAITLRAKKEGKSPQEIVDFYHQLNKDSFAEFGISFDYYHRTSSKEHHETAAAFFSQLEQNGVFRQEVSEQFYDEEYEQFLADRYITGTCPKCANPNAYGDQCEKCGSALSPNELIHPKSTLSDQTPVLKSTKHWYLPMQNDEEWLRDWIENGLLEGEKQHDPKIWRKQVIGQCKSWIDGGLHERAMTRDLDWGVPVPAKDAAGKVLYVWLDAPIGYISATKAWAKENNEDWESYWKGDHSDIIHFIGKDNIVFHCIIFPILLKRHGGFNLPVNVPANEFLNLEGQKISTSRDWAVWLQDYLRDFPEQEDYLRYTLNAIAPETKDSEFTWADFQSRVNSELVAIYGNFINRTLVLTHKYYEGIVPEGTGVTEKFKEEVSLLQEYKKELNDLLDNYRFRDAQTAAMKIARLGNKFLADQEPWKKIKTDAEDVQDIMNLSLQIAANACIAFQVFMPRSSKKLASMLQIDQAQWSNVGNVNLLESGHKIAEAAHLFTRIEDQIVETQIEKLKSKTVSEEVNKYQEIKPNIAFEDFMKLDLRVGEIKSAAAVEKSNKLLALKVDIGSETRLILSGIAKHFKAEELVGTKVQVLCNLPPRKMMGMESNGMLLLAEDSEGKLHLIGPTDPDSPNGSTIS